MFYRCEQEAIVQFLENQHTYRVEQKRARQRLLAKTRQNPGVVLDHLCLLPANDVKRDPLLRQLKHEALAASGAKSACG